MKGWEMIKALSEGKKITTINGLFDADYFCLRNRSELVFKRKDGVVVEIKSVLSAKYLFIGDDWIEYKDGFTSLGDSITALKRKEYIEIMEDVRNKNKGAGI